MNCTEDNALIVIRDGCKIWTDEQGLTDGCLGIDVLGHSLKPPTKKTIANTVVSTASLACVPTSVTSQIKASVTVSDSFGTGKRTTNVKQRAAAKMETRPVFPIFFTAANMVTDRLWRDVFMKMSKGVYRKGFKYYPNGSEENSEGGELGRYIYRTKTKDFDCVITSDPADVIETVKNFMTKRINLISETEQITIDESVRMRMLDEQMSISWDGIKNNGSRSILATHYVNSQKGLSPSEKSDLQNVIGLGISCDVLCGDSIRMENGVIVSISGVRKNKETGHFYIDEELIVPKPKMSIRDTVSASAPEGAVGRVLTSSIFNSVVARCLIHMAESSFEAEDTFSIPAPEEAIDGILGKS